MLRTYRYGGILESNVILYVQWNPILRSPFRALFHFLRHFLLIKNKIQIAKTDRVKYPK